MISIGDSDPHQIEKVLYFETLLSYEGAHPRDHGEETMSPWE